MIRRDGLSDRLVQQRLRNRAIEALELLAEGDAGVRRAGVGEYVSEFFDVIDDESPWNWRGWSCLTAQEVEALSRVHQLLVEACSTTRPTCDDDEFVASGWPAKVSSAASLALAIMHMRGRFREDVEEGHPSGC